MTPINTIKGLPSLGPKSSAMLALAGIDSVEQLREIGAVVAYLRVKRVSDRASLNLLWALEAALTGVPWQQVARNERSRLLMTLDDQQRSRA